MKEDINREVDAIKRVRVSTCTIQNNVLKIESKHLIFKTSIAGMKTHLFVDNGNEAELNEESFIHTNKLSIFKQEKCINLILENSKVIQKLMKEALINIIIRNYSK